MIRSFLFSFFSFTILVVLIVGLSNSNPGNAQGVPNEHANPRAQENIPVCPGPLGDDAVRCHARVVTDQRGNPQVTNNVVRGLTPSQLRKAYNLSGTTAVTKTIAIVDAYNHPNILQDLNKYSNTFGLPTMSSCPVSQGTEAAPCFQKVDQNGGTNYPVTNAGWALEIALDVEAAHAICQNCNILLVEARSNSYSNLLTAVDRARLMNASIISNSWGSGEFSSEVSFDSYFNHPGVVYTFSSGDGGYGVQYPAASQYVTAVGGTTLNLNPDNSYNSESVWAGAGSGCSLYEPQPAFQTNLGLSGCAKRMVADVSAVADPNTGAAVYNSVSYFGQKGWFQVGGTSLAAPVVAGVYALAGGAPAGVQGNSIPYSLGDASNLNDILTGNNGNCGNYLCKGGAGYDGPTGLGTPRGFSAF
jgi:subtilase family serine protease